MKHFLLAACLLLAAAFAWGADEPAADIKTEAADLGGNATLLVRSDTREVGVWLDFAYRGNAPADIAGLKPGKYALLLKKPGYYDRSLSLTLAANTKTTVNVELVMITGFIDLHANAPGAFLVFDGEDYCSGLVELPSGIQDLTIRAFGYQDLEMTVIVPERLAQTLNVTLEPAPFAASGFGLSETSFNPRNSGLKGRTTLSFQVTAPGRATLSITAADGSVVHEDGSGPFDTWSQDLSWDGLDDEGSMLPDGEYRVALRVYPAEGIEYEQESYEYEAAIRLDSSIILVPAGMSAALPGPSLAWAGFAPGIDGVRMGGGMLAVAKDPSSPQFAASMNAGFSLKDSFDAGISLRVGTSPGQALLKAGLRYGPKPTGIFSFGAALDGTVSWDMASTPSDLRLGIPLAVGTRFAYLTLAPDIGAYWSPDWSAKLGGQAALVLAGYGAGAELSARVLSTALGDGSLGIDPLAQVALDLNVLPPGLPLAFSLHGQISLNPAVTAWEAGLYIGANF